MPRRAHALGLVAAALALTLPQPQPTLAAAPAGGIRSLVNLLRVQSYVRELAGSLRATPDGAPPEVNAQIKYIVRVRACVRACVLNQEDRIHSTRLEAEGSHTRENPNRTT